MSSSPSSTLVLVTGGSGFVGQHVILQLLAAGYKVRTTIRSLSSKDSVLSALKAGSATDAQLSNLSFVAADLGSDAGWTDAAKGCTYVQHVASPFPLGAPKHEDDIIVPAREGTLRVLRAARDAGSVQRVVLTSSFAAVGYGQPFDATKVFTEADWSDPDGPNMTAYTKSKAIAERAAWDFVAKEAPNLELCTIQPTAIFGPTLSSKYATSLEIPFRMLSSQLPLAPDVSFGVVDVRDVADVHFRAMTHPDAKGERFIATDEFMTMLEIAGVLRERLSGEEWKGVGKRAPTRTLPHFLLRVGAWFNKDLGLLVPEMGKRKKASSDKAKRVLGWKPRSAEEAVVAAGESLVRVGLVK